MWNPLISLWEEHQPWIPVSFNSSIFLEIMYLMLCFAMLSHDEKILPTPQVEHTHNKFFLDIWTESYTFSPRPVPRRQHRKLLLDQNQATRSCRHHTLSVHPRLQPLQAPANDCLEARFQLRPQVWIGCWGCRGNRRPRTQPGTRRGHPHSQPPQAEVSSDGLKERCRLVSRAWTGYSGCQESAQLQPHWPRFLAFCLYHPSK